MVYSYIDWDHPEVEKLISDKINNRPGALSYGRIAKAASIILNREIKHTSVHWHISSLKNRQSKLQQQPLPNGTSKFSNSAPYSKIGSKERKLLHGISIETLLDDVMDTMNEWQIKINALNSSIIEAKRAMQKAIASSENLKNKLKIDQNSNLHLPPSDGRKNFSDSAPFFNNVQKQFVSMESMPLGSANVIETTNEPFLNQINASAVMKNFFAQSNNILLGLNTTGNLKANENLKPPQKEEQPKPQKFQIKEGLTSNLNPCLLVENDGKIWEYSYSFERNGIKFYKCLHCQSHGKSNGSYMRIFIDGQIKAGEHNLSCQPQTKFISDISQECRNERLGSTQSHSSINNFYQEIIDGKKFELRSKNGIPNAELIIFNNGKCYKYFLEKSQNIYFCCQCNIATAKLHIKEDNGELYVTLGKNEHRC